MLIKKMYIFSFLRIKYFDIFFSQETLQPFVNDLFNSIFGLSKNERIIPPSVKFLFDFLDEEAEKLGITDAEVHHTWKNNRYYDVLYAFKETINDICQRPPMMVYFIYIFFS